MAACSLTKLYSAWIRSSFAGDAWFDKAAFGRGASFGEAAFTGNAGFGEVTFTGDAWFDRAAFGRGASFGEAAFGGEAGFGEAAFSGGADALHFEQARILSPGASHVLPTGWRLADADGGGHTVVRANDDGGSLAAGQTCAAAEVALAFLTLPGSSRRARRDCAGRRLGSPEAREDVNFIWLSTRERGF